MTVREIASKFGLLQPQLRALMFFPFDIASFRRNVDRDFQRIEWFMDAAFAKLTELVVEGTMLLQAGQVDQAQVVGEKAKRLAKRVSFLQGEYFRVARDIPGKLSLSRLLGKWDPFTKQRELARAIAIEFGFELELRKEIGCKE